jgi:hypothetical protein
MEVTEEATCNKVGTVTGYSLESGKACQFRALNTSTCMSVQGSSSDCSVHAGSPELCNNDAGCEALFTSYGVCEQVDRCKLEQTEDACLAVKKPDTTNQCFFTTTSKCLDISGKGLAEQKGTCKYDRDRERADGDLSQQLCGESCAEEFDYSPDAFEVVTDLYSAAGTLDYGEDPNQEYCSNLSSQECSAARDLDAVTVCEYRNPEASCHVNITWYNESQAELLNTTGPALTPGIDPTFPDPGYLQGAPSTSTYGTGSLSLTELCKYGSRQKCISDHRCVFVVLKDDFPGNFYGSTGPGYDYTMPDLTGPGYNYTMPDLTPPDGIEQPDVPSKSPTLGPTDPSDESAWTCQPVKRTQDEKCARYSGTSACMQQPLCEAQASFDFAGASEAAAADTLLNIDELLGGDESTLSAFDKRALQTSACSSKRDADGCKSVKFPNEQGVNESVCELTIAVTTSCNQNQTYAQQLSIGSEPVRCELFFDSETDCKAQGSKCEWAEALPLSTCALKPHKCFGYGDSFEDCENDKECIFQGSGICTVPSARRRRATAECKANTEPEVELTFLERLNCQCIEPNSQLHYSKYMCEAKKCEYFAASGTDNGGKCVPNYDEGESFDTGYQGNGDSLATFDECSCAKDETAQGCAEYLKDAENNDGGVGALPSDAEASCGMIHLKCACDAKVGSTNEKLCAWSEQPPQYICLDAGESASVYQSANENCNNAGYDASTGVMNRTDCEARGCEVTELASDFDGYCQMYDKCTNQVLATENNCNLEDGCKWSTDTFLGVGGYSKGTCIKDDTQNFQCKSEECCYEITEEKDCAEKKDSTGTLICNFVKAASSSVAGVCVSEDFSGANQCNYTKFTESLMVADPSEAYKQTKCEEVEHCRWDTGAASAGSCSVKDPCLTDDMDACKAAAKCSVLEQTYEAVKGVPPGANDPATLNICVRKEVADGYEMSTGSNIGAPGELGIYEESCFSKFNENSCGTGTKDGRPTCLWVEEESLSLGDDFISGVGGDVGMRTGSCTKFQVCRTKEAASGESKCFAAGNGKECEWERKSIASLDGTCKAKFSLSADAVSALAGGSQTGSDAGSYSPLYGDSDFVCVARPEGSVSTDDEYLYETQTYTTATDTTVTPVPPGCCYQSNADDSPIKCEDNIKLLTCENQIALQFNANSKTIKVQHFAGVECKDTALKNGDYGCKERPPPTLKPTESPTLSPPVPATPTQGVIIQLVAVETCRTKEAASDEIKCLAAGNGMECEWNGKCEAKDRVVYLKGWNSKSDSGNSYYTQIVELFSMFAKSFALGLTPEQVQKVAGDAIEIEHMSTTIKVKFAPLFKLSGYSPLVPKDAPKLNQRYIKRQLATMKGKRLGKGIMNSRGNDFGLKMTGYIYPNTPGSSRYTTVADVEYVQTEFATPPPPTPRPTPPTPNPTGFPTEAPTSNPTTGAPSPSPTVSPSVSPTAAPSSTAETQQEKENRLALAEAAAQKKAEEEAKAVADEAAALLAEFQRTLEEAQNATGPLASDTIKGVVNNKTACAQAEALLTQADTNAITKCTVVTETTEKEIVAVVITVPVAKPIGDAIDRAKQKYATKKLLTLLVLDKTATEYADFVVSKMPGIDTYVSATIDTPDRQYSERRSARAATEWELTIDFGEAFEQNVVDAAVDVYNNKVEEGLEYTINVDSTPIKVNADATDVATADTQKKNVTETVTIATIDTDITATKEQVAEANKTANEANEALSKQVNATRETTEKLEEQGLCGSAGCDESIKDFEQKTAEKAEQAEQEKQNEKRLEEAEKAEGASVVTPKVVLKSTTQAPADPAAGDSGSSSPIIIIVVIFIVVILLAFVGVIFIKKRQMDMKADNAMSTYANPTYAAGMGAGLPGAGLPGAAGGNLDVREAAGGGTSSGGKLVRQESLC